MAVPLWPELAAAGASMATAEISRMALPSRSLAPGNRVSVMLMRVVNPFAAGRGTHG